MKPILLLVALSFSATAKADEAVQRSIDIQPSRHEVNVHLGYQAGFGGSLGSPSGLKLVADYAYKVQRFTWFNLQVGNTFGFGGHDGLCVNSTDSQCYRGGWDFEIAAGVRLSWQLKRVPMNFEVPLLVGVDVLYNRDCGDNGAAFPVLKPGVRAKYFVTPRVGLGVGVNFAFGPSMHSGGASVCTTRSYTDFYGAVDILMGAEFIL
jgi:hypothetical protein